MDGFYKVVGYFLMTFLLFISIYLGYQICLGIARIFRINKILKQRDCSYRQLVSLVFGMKKRKEVS